MEIKCNSVTSLTKIKLTFTWNTVCLSEDAFSVLVEFRTSIFVIFVHTNIYMLLFHHAFVETSSLLLQTYFESRTFN